MRITPTIGLLITLVLFTAMYVLVPGYAEWLQRLVAP